MCTRRPKNDPLYAAEPDDFDDIYVAARERVVLRIAATRCHPEFWKPRQDTVVERHAFVVMCGSGRIMELQYPHVSCRIARHKPRSLECQTVKPSHSIQCCQTSCAWPIPELDCVVAPSDCDTSAI